MKDAVGKHLRELLPRFPHFRLGPRWKGLIFTVILAIFTEFVVVCTAILAIFTAILVVGTAILALFITILALLTAILA